MVGRVISLRPARHRRRVDVPAGVGVAQRVVEAVGVAVVALRVGGRLQHGVGAQEALQAGSVGTPVHVDEAQGGQVLVAGVAALAASLFRCRGYSTPCSSQLTIFMGIRHLRIAITVYTSPPTACNSHNSLHMPVVQGNTRL